MKISTTAVWIAGALASACSGGTESSKAESAVARAWFEEVAGVSGVDFRHMRGKQQRFWYPEIIGSGVGLFDYDGDGDLDLYALQSGDLSELGAEAGANRLFQNTGGGNFRDITDQAGVGDRGYGMGCAAGDYDNDGDLDLYVTNLGANVLYQNRGDGTFEDVSVAAGVAHSGWGMSAAFRDFDSDGDLDLFVVNYLNWRLETELECTSSYGSRDYCEPINYNAPATDLYLRNEGDGTFSDQTHAAGLREAFGNGMGLALGDYDRDGDVDAYVTNDGTSNQLWINDGSGHFQDRSLLAGCALSGDGHAEASMGVSPVDFDQDGDLDLFMTHLRGETNTLYVNENGTFQDRTSRSGLGRASLRFTGFGMGFADFDLDGTLDLFVANGRVGYWKPPFDTERPYVEPDQLFRGLEGGRFEEIEGVEALGYGNGRGLAFGDLDDDGDLDLVVSDNHGPLRILRNVTEKRGRWIGLRVLNAHGSDAVGAEVTLEVAGVERYLVVDPAYSYCCSNDPRLFCGLGQAQQVERVLVRYPDGSSRSFGPLVAGQLHELRP